MYGMYIPWIWITHQPPLRHRQAWLINGQIYFAIIINEHEFPNMLYACNTFMVLKGYKKIW